MKTKLEPLGDKLLVRKLASEDRTAGGIVLPDIAKKKPERGKVIAVGPGKKLEDGQVVPCTVKVGQTVLFDPFAGCDIRVAGEELLILPEPNVLAIII
jgi:chaperonin GroES